MKSIPGHIVSLGPWVPPIVSIPLSGFPMTDSRIIAMGRLWASKWHHIQAYHLETRAPYWASSPSTYSWHHDCGSLTDWMIVWATALPTQFRLHGRLMEADPFEVVLVDNKTCEHRTPLTAYQKGSPPRWFARVLSNDPQLKTMIHMKGDLDWTNAKPVNIPRVREIYR